MTVSKRTREAVYERDGHQCVVAGFPSLIRAHGACWGGLTVQHCVGRGSGGSRLFDDPELLITMCNSHNGLLTSDAEFARVGRLYGWVKSRNARRDPKLQPVFYVDGWHILAGVKKRRIPDIEAIEYLTLIGVWPTEQPNLRTEIR